MSDAVLCPTQQQLAAFGLGKLPEQEVAAVAAHLDSCSKCSLAVAAVTKDSFIKKVRDANLGGSSFPPNPPRPTNPPPKADRQPPPASLCPNLPPELANHPKYRILRELGRGGMGVVYQGRQTGMMDRPVVIKVINRALLDNPDAIERFLREARAAAKLSHPNIVTAYDSEKAGELHMLVMEFVPGQNLAELLEKKGPFPVVYACHFTRQVALGLQHAHERGMVHRDIKPQNLILSLKNHVKILDFGLAKIASESGTGTGLTSTNAYMGTPEYSAPEQAEDARNADIRADLYSLGCTLYCLLAGRPPFREETWVKTVLAHIQKVPQPLPELRPDVPERLWRVVARLLAKKPGQRYQKPQEVVQALAPFVKPGAKPETKSGPVQVVALPGKNTVIVADTGEIKKVLREVPGKAPPKNVQAREEPSPVADRIDADATPEPALTAWWKRPGVVAGAISVSLALILMAVIIIKVMTAEGTIVLEKLPPDADVLVDGSVVTVKLGEGNSFEIRVAPGKKHRLEVKKEGVKYLVEKEIEVDGGGRKSVLVRLEQQDRLALPQQPPPKQEAVDPKHGRAPQKKDDARQLASEEEWIREVRALSAEQQLEKVKAKLMERNPGFEDALKPTCEHGVVTGLEFLTDHVTDISPVRALTGLRALKCFGSNLGKGQLADLSSLKGMKLMILACYYTRVSDLSPLKDMPLTDLDCNGSQVSDLSPLMGMKLMRLQCALTRVSDLSPLKDMPLSLLSLEGTGVSDLSPLKGMPLTWLACGLTQITDLSPLKGMPLTYLNFHRTRVSDLSPLKGMKLTWLACAGTRVTDLSPLKDMPLTILHCHTLQVLDLSPLKGMPLKEVWCDFRPERDAEILRSIPTLEKINDKPVAQFWKEVDDKSTSGRPPKPEGQGFVPPRSRTEQVSFETLDHADLAGTLYHGWKGKQGMTVLMLHGLRENRSTPGWRHLAEALQAEGHTVLTFDFRGHGDSQKVSPKFWTYPVNKCLPISPAVKRSNQLKVENLPTKYVAWLIEDIAAARTYLDLHHDKPDSPVNTFNLVVIGARQASALGSLWLATEGLRFNAADVGDKIVLKPPEKLSIRQVVWIGVEDPLKLSSSGLYGWLRDAHAKPMVPITFIYGADDPDTSNLLREAIREKLGNSMVLPETHLSGQQLLDDDASAAQRIQHCLAKTFQSLVPADWVPRKIKNLHSYWALPVAKTPDMRLLVTAKRPGEERLSAVPMRQLGIPVEGAEEVTGVLHKLQKP